MENRWQDNPLIIGAGVLFILCALAASIFLFVVEMEKGVSPLWTFSIYWISLWTFHFLDFLMTFLFNYHIVSFSSTLLNHSYAYWIACAVACGEYWIEAYLFPEMKTCLPVIFAGIVVILVGQFFRTCAMATAKGNFNHIVQDQKQAGHQLVTHGVYKILRHPSYFGFFWWSVGTQITLANPVCVFAFAYASWSFFADRIPYEEYHLMRFFSDYAEYRKRTYIGIPFIPDRVSPD